MQRNAVEQEAIAVAEEWLALVDRNDYVASWDKSSASFKSGVQTPSLFKRSISQREWQSSVAAVQTKLGQAESRSLKSKRYAKDLPGEPAGDYIVIE